MYANLTASSALPTCFLPSERRTPLEVMRQVELLDADGTLKRLLDSIPSLIAVLNHDRQVLFGNAALVKLAQSLHMDQLTGLRLGELLFCRRAMAAKYGCGTAEACRTCGAAQATACALRGQPMTKECRIATQDGDAYDLQVMASPFAWQGRSYLMLVLGDITSEKRRQVLERIFFHDVLNTAGSVSGIAAVIAEEPAASYELKDDLLASAESLVGEIKSQQLLLAAERGELQPELQLVHLPAALEAIQKVYRNHPACVGKRLETDPESADARLMTDPVLLQRVLANMVKNALEATAPGGTVLIGATINGSNCTLWCQNPGEIPRAHALQIFQRNFSTKGAGRGIGTYGIKLLGERFLAGSVGFTTSAESGTRFTITLPL